MLKIYLRAKKLNGYGLWFPLVLAITIAFGGLLQKNIQNVEKCDGSLVCEVFRSLWDEKVFCKSPCNLVFEP
jgi:hypothetical protein